MALGARAGSVIGMAMREGRLLALAGVSLGGVGALALMRVIASMLFGVTAEDPATYLTVALLLAGVALAASYVPARRATRIDPMAALRCE